MYSCKICPFECGVDRNSRPAGRGVCGLPRKILVSKYQRHFFEEPPLSGAEPMISGCSCGDCDDSDRRGGSGAVFFTGCNGRCVFCQNFKISQKENWGKKILNNGKFFGEVSDEGLFKICRELIDAGAHNINFVSPTPYSELLLKFLKKRKKGLGVPVVWNSNGYEKASTIKKLKGFVDVYLPDLKYFSDDLAVKYSKMPSYFKFASKAIKEMVSQVGWPVIGEDRFIRSGVIIRHLVLPGCIGDSKKVLKWIFSEFGVEAFVALMAQYYPTYKACDYPEINRCLTADEYEEISSYFFEFGFKDGLVQELSAADERYTPEF